MRICILTTATTVHQMGGTEVHAETLAAEAARQEHTVILVTTAHPDGLETERKDGYTIKYLGGTRHTMSRRESPAWWLASSKQTAKLCETEKIDVVWGENFSGISYAAIPRERRRPVISIVQGLAIRGEIASNFSRVSTPGELLYFITRYAAQTLFYYIPRFRAMVQDSDLLVGVSRETAEALAREFPGSAARTRVIFNPVDTDFFRPDPALRDKTRLQLGLAQGTMAILMSGVVHKQKGMHHGLAAFSGIAGDFPGTKLLVVGGGPQLEDLKTAAAGAGLADRVIFCGPKKNSEMPAYYNAADIYLNPTLRLEGLPVVIAEAMACGLPCVVSKTGGTGSTLEDGKSGFFVKPGKTEGFKSRLSELIKDAGLRGRLASEARTKAVKDFDLKTNLAAYVAASREVLKS